MQQRNEWISYYSESSLFLLLQSSYHIFWHLLIVLLVVPFLLHLIGSVSAHFCFGSSTIENRMGVDDSANCLEQCEKLLNNCRRFGLTFCFERPNLIALHPSPVAILSASYYHEMSRRLLSEYLSNNQPFFHLRWRTSFLQLKQCSLLERGKLRIGTWIHFMYMLGEKLVYDLQKALSSHLWKSTLVYYRVAASNFRKC